jgi:hypothetical protein
MAAFGASCPFPWVLANVPSPNPQQPFATGNGTDAPEFGLFLAGSAGGRWYLRRKRGRARGN